MKSSCVACKDIVWNSVHLCNAVRDIQHNDNDNYGVFACRSFEWHFDLTLGEETCICNSNLMLDSNNKDLFFYRITPPPEQDTQPPSQWAMSWKDMSVLCTEAIWGLTSFMNSFMQKADIHRPAYDTICANKVWMYLSRIDQPLKKCNNDKGSIKLKNHSQAILELGQMWMDNYVTEKLFIIDLTDQTGESYIKKSKDFIQFPHSNHKVIMHPTLDKLGNYLKHNW